MHVTEQDVSLPGFTTFSQNIKYVLKVHSFESLISKPFSFCCLLGYHHFKNLKL